MKKITILLWSILLLVLAGCENSNSGDGGTYGELIKMGKYIGMSKSDVINDLNKSSWKWVESCPYTSNGAYTKKISGHDVFAYVDYIEESNLCYALSFFITDESDCYNQTVNLYNGIGEKYTFVNGGNIFSTAKEAPFSYIQCMKDASSEMESIYSYSDGKKKLSANRYFFVGAQWMDKTVSQGEGATVVLYFDSYSKMINFVFQIQ